MSIDERADPLIFGDNHHFTLSQTGLTFLGIFVGELLAISMEPIWRRVRGRLQKRREEAGGEPGGSEPEFRLPPTVFGAPMVTIGLFGFAFTTYSFVHWIGKKAISIPKKDSPLTNVAA